MASTDSNSGSIEDGTDDGSNAQFIRGLLTYLYSGNLSDKDKAAAAIKAFVRLLQDFGHLEKCADKWTVAQNHKRVHAGARGETRVFTALC
ncbi:hypothetical protein DFQ27_003505 [Actinomortierella ambigua]|uniref:Uncharacterized protein n=1 Tax=Actinomortierella ambigua TaxID=1343610 RepID=A0A9P6U5E4_9FUNG|nr:hypothetical protein DFQ27_003505 [Actinomortierella ambigua]